MSSRKTALVIGGTGAQGSAVVRALAESGWTVSILTRNPSNPAAIELASLPNIKLIEGNPLDEVTLTQTLPNHVLLFVNTNGFAIGEKAEIYWGIRIYELAVAAHIEHFIYATIDYASKLGHFDPALRCGHADGKGKVAEFVRAQPLEMMSWSILHSGPYMETLSEMLRPQYVEAAEGEAEGTWVFAAPLGNGEVPLIVLSDIGVYGAWLANNPDRAAGMTLKASTAQVKWADLSAAFTAVTGKKASYKDISLDEYFKSGVFPNPEAKVGHGAGTGGEKTLMTYRQNFTGFWNMWKRALAQRDYELLDEIYPARIKSVEEWMRKVGFTGEAGSVLKDYKDRKGNSPSAKVDGK